jgi:endonuclease III-like uncharacterized protein
MDNSNCNTSDNNQIVDRVIKLFNPKIENLENKIIDIEKKSDDNLDDQEINKCNICNKMRRVCRTEGFINGNYIIDLVCDVCKAKQNLKDEIKEMIEELLEQKLADIKEQFDSLDNVGECDLCHKKRRIYNSPVYIQSVSGTRYYNKYFCSVCDNKDNEEKQKTLTKYER